MDYGAHVVFFQKRQHEFVIAHVVLMKNYAVVLRNGLAMSDAKIVNSDKLCVFARLKKSSYEVAADVSGSTGDQYVTQFGLPLDRPIKNTRSEK